jgi:hypothetical protein
MNCKLRAGVAARTGSDRATQATFIEMFNKMNSLAFYVFRKRLQRIRC